MTISTTSRDISYACDGSTTSYPVPFPFFATSDLTVVAVNSKGVGTTLVLGTGYSVSGGNGLTGTVNLTTAYASGCTLHIVSSVPYTQPTSFRNQGRFLASAHENAFDRMSMQVQQLNSRTSYLPNLNWKGQLDFHGLQLINAADAQSGFDIPNWGQVEQYVQDWLSKGSGFVPVDFVFTGDGSTTQFSIPGVTVSTPILYLVTVDGVVQSPRDAYTIDISGPYIEFTTAPASDTTIEVRVNGYSKFINDVGAFASLLAGQTGSDHIGYTSSVSGSVYQTVESKLRRTVDIVDCGAVAGSDIGIIINSMIDKGIYNIYIPEGEWLLSTKVKITVNYVTIRGCGSSTIINIENIADDIFYMKSVSYVLISDMQLQASTTKTGGSAIMGENTYACCISNIQLTNATGYSNYHGFYLDGCNSTIVCNCTLRGGNGDGITLTGSTQRCEDTYIVNTNAASFNRDMVISWSSGTYMMNMDILAASEDGIIVNPGSGQEVDGLRAVNILSDSNVGNGWSFVGTGHITEVSLSNCWGSSNGSTSSPACGLVISNSSANGIGINSSEFHGNTAQGIAVQSGLNIKIHGNSSFGNSSGSSGSFDSIFINSDASYISIIGNSAGLGGIVEENGATVADSKYGIRTIPTDHIMVCNNILRGNVTSGAYITSGDNVKVHGNIGYVDASSGSSSISSGSSSVVVDHGLDNTPSVANISITPTSSNHVYLDSTSVTDTSFTVLSSSSLSSDGDFVWSAHL